MIRYYLLAIYLVCCLNVQAQDNEAAIRKVLATQVKAWNAGSIEYLKLVKAPRIGPRFRAAASE